LARRPRNSGTASPTRRGILGGIIAALLAALVAWLPQPDPPGFRAQPERAEQGLRELERWASSSFVTAAGDLGDLPADDDARAQVASVVIGTCIMSLAAAEAGTREQAAEGRALYGQIRDRLLPILGREPMLSDVTGAPIPESSRWPS
jgi:hypothetical protein